MELTKYYYRISDGLILKYITLGMRNRVANIVVYTPEYAALHSACVVINTAIKKIW